MKVKRNLRRDGGDLGWKKRRMFGSSKIKAKICEIKNVK